MADSHAHIKTKSLSPGLGIHYCLKSIFHFSSLLDYRKEVTIFPMRGKQTKLYCNRQKHKHKSLKKFKFTGENNQYNVNDGFKHNYSEVE